MRFSIPNSRVSVLATCLLAISQLGLALDVPQVFKNTNLLRTVDTSKGYVKETVAVIIENISDKPQTEYYLPIYVPLSSAVSFIEAKDKKEGSTCEVEYVESDSIESLKYYRITLPYALAPKATVTLGVSAGISGLIDPVPAIIAQNEKQFLRYTGTRYAPSAYLTEKQKTKFRAPNNEVPDYTKFEGKDDPARSGYTITYGPYDNIKPGQLESISVRFEYTLPVVHMNKLERDIEVSHWGGNLAVEERYWMTNNGAKMKNQFSRVQWATTSYYNPPTHAIKQLNYNLLRGSKDAYFTDEIGNVSTSRFRANARETSLELKPRYPVFGGWNYSFVVGWNNDLPNFLRKGKSNEYVLKVPLIEGPTQSTTYDQVEVRIILPEGASDVKYTTSVPIHKEERLLHKTFMDTIGRTTLKLSIDNVVDEVKDREIIVTYHYTTGAALRKPLIVLSSAFSIFLVYAILGRLDLSIGK